MYIRLSVHLIPSHPHNTTHQQIESVTNSMARQIKKNTYIYIYIYIGIPAQPAPPPSSLCRLHTLHITHELNESVTNSLGTE